MSEYITDDIEISSDFDWEDSDEVNSTKLHKWYKKPIKYFW